MRSNETCPPVTPARATQAGFASAAVLVALLLAAALPAQWRSEGLRIPGKAVRFVVPDKLTATPLQLGAEGPHLVAKYEPTDDGDFIWGKYGSYAWGVYLYRFQTGAADEGEAGDGDGQSGPSEDLRTRLIRERIGAKNFDHWVREKDPNLTGSRRFLVKGKKKSGGKNRPDSYWWEYFDVRKFSYGGREDELVIYKTTCVYDLGDQELAVNFYLPLKSGEKPDAKYSQMARQVLTSLDFADLEADEDLDARRDEFADSPARQAALKKLKANIGDLKNWDYFTTPNYIFTFSWEYDKPQTKRDMYRFSREMEARLEEVREKFEEFYPPEKSPGALRRGAPVTGQAEGEEPAAPAADEVYSVIRICNDIEEFHKYGNTQYGVVGWFSPMSKELVIYYDKGRVFLQSEDEMLSVCYHEAWHQYSDQYFPEVELHRWFDEGLAEYFGSLRKKGKRWSHVFHDGRLSSLQRQARSGQLIPSADIVTWDRAKFYGPRAADHYAQAYAMVDFLVRGKDVLGKRWDERWSEILPIYAQVCLTEKSDTKAVAAAFEGVDWPTFEAGWNEWWEKNHIKRR